jgi:hypothetical protein
MYGEVDSEFYEFYSLNKIADAVTQLGDYGIPRHGESIVQIKNPESCFVFADYSINLIAYVIRLSNIDFEQNEVYAICGDDHKVIANSFSEFISIYLNDSGDLLI